MEIWFLVKKFISFFIEPLGFVFAIFALGIYFLFVDKKRLSKYFLSFSFGLLFLFSYQPFSNFLVKNLENQYLKYDYKQHVKYIHVLGSGHNIDASLPLSSSISSAGTKRVLEGIIIHFKTPGSKLIFTGYKGDTNTSNGRMNANLAIALGVKEENIIIDEKSKDTQEEAIFTKSILKEEAFALVTSATHMPRSMKIFKSLRLNPIAAPTNFHKEEFNDYLSAPDVVQLEYSVMSVHEYIGILWSKIRN